MMLLSENVKKNRFKEILDNIADNKLFLISFLVLIFGMLFGAVYVGRVYENNSFFESEFNKYLEYRISAPFLNLFFKSYFNGLMIFGLMLLSSIGIIGIPLIPTFLFFKGFGTAAFLGLLYKHYRLTGVAFSNLVIVPPFVFLGFLFCVFAAKALPLSIGFIKLLKGDGYNSSDLKMQLIICLRKFLVCVVFLIIISLVEALLSIGFLRFFKF